MSVFLKSSLNNETSDQVALFVAMAGKKSSSPLPSMLALLGLRILKLFGPSGGMDGGRGKR